MTLHGFVNDDGSVHDKRWLLVRLFIYQAMVLLEDRVADLHVPDLTTDIGLTDFLYLRSFVFLCVVLDYDQFGALAHQRPVSDVELCADAQPAIDSDRFRQISVAWDMVRRLDKYLESHYRFGLKPERNKHSSLRAAMKVCLYIKIC